MRCAEQNVEVAAGQLGQPPSDGKQNFQITVRVSRHALGTPDEFDNIIIKNSAEAASCCSKMWATPSSAQKPTPPA